MPDHARARRPRFALPRRVWVPLVAVIVALAIGSGGWLWYLNHQLSNVDRIQLAIPEQNRPAPAQPAAPGTTKPLNILLAGADAGHPSIADEVASGHWLPGSHRSDTIMILHLTADRKHAYLVSIPRDSWVPVPGHGHAKVNAAFSLGGPDLYVQTIEQLTGLRMDHLAIIDWSGFKDLTTALGGVQVYIPHTVYDSAQHLTWTQGYHTLQGAEALSYVRTRHGLTNGDFDRIRRQQNFLRLTMRKLMSAGTMDNPLKLTRALGAITKNLTVDADLTNSSIRDLALSLRNLHASDVTFVTIPTSCCPTIDGQSTVAVNYPQMRALMKAVAADDLGSYLREYGRGTVLQSSNDVS